MITARSRGGEPFGQQPVGVRRDLADQPGRLARQPGRRIGVGDFPPEDLATAGRVLTIVTARANAELAGLELP